MATRAAAHAAATDTSPVDPTAPQMTASNSTVDGASIAPSAASQLASHVALDASAYEPSPTNLSAYANAAAVAASTAVLTPAPVSSAPTSTSTVGPARTRAATAASVSSPSPYPNSSSSPSPSSSGLPLSSPPPPPLLPMATRTGKLASSRPSSKFGTVNYSVDEMRRLNEKVRAVMPIASDDWLHVAYQFNYMRPESIPYREVESLKRKFKKMYCSRASAGGKLPAYAQEAKELRRQINQRTERTQTTPGESVPSDSQSEMDGQDETAIAATGDGDGGASDETAMGPATGGNDGDGDGDATSGSLETSSLETAVAQDDVAMSTASMGVETTATTGETGAGMDDTRDIATRLRLMEDEYHRTMAAKRGSLSAATDGPSSGFGYTDNAAVLGSPSLGLAGLASVGSFGTGATGDTTTTGIINLLKHSIERKRRTIEEQMLSESERVRKERKKRKMEQVLYNIHREQTGVPAVGAVGDMPTSGAGTAAFQQHTLLAAAAASSAGAMLSSPSPSSLVPSQDASATSLGVMEVVLQFMMAQQQETARRNELEDERRRIEADERVRRRRLKDAQRRKDKHETMLVMAALLQENFPEELRQYLDPASARDDVGDSGHAATDAAVRTNGASAIRAKALDSAVTTDRGVEDALI